jgi:hypothetical protein
MLEQLNTLFIGTILGGLFKYLFDTFKARFDYQNQALNALLKERWDEYQKLWAISGELPKWPRNRQLTISQLHDLSTRMKEWYFGKGGMMLSQESRRQYEFVQDGLMLACQKEADPQKPVTEADYEQIRLYFSGLRSELTRDLMSRKRQILL